MLSRCRSAYQCQRATPLSLPRQVLDSLLYRMRLKRFISFKPVVIFSVAMLEWRVCQLTCQAMPGK